MGPRDQVGGDSMASMLSGLNAGNQASDEVVGQLYVQELQCCPA